MAKAKRISLSATGDGEYQVRWDEHGVRHSKAFPRLWAARTFIDILRTN